MVGESAQVPQSCIPALNGMTAGKGDGRVDTIAVMQSKETPSLGDPLSKAVGTTGESGPTLFTVLEIVLEGAEGRFVSTRFSFIIEFT